MGKLNITILLFALSMAFGQAQTNEKADSICSHPIVWSSEGKILSWYNPETEGDGYDHVIKLASEFLRDQLPNDPETGLKLYYLYCEIDGPESGRETYSGRSAPNNPSCVFAGLTESLAVKYRIYSGDESYLQLVKECLDYMLKNGTSPSSEDWVWASSPYSSSSPRDTMYRGSGYWGTGGGDGVLVLEPDKVGEMGVAYLQFFEITEESVYLDAALACADALAKNVREGNYKQSPWPFRVHARTGAVLEEYCSNVLPPIKLFDELFLIQDRLKIANERIDAYKKARQTAWEWLFSWEGPMKTFVWKGYFEDVQFDHENKNRVQITPLEVARYLIQHPEYDSFYKENVPALINWCNSVFGMQNALGYNAQCEQLLCICLRYVVCIKWL
jgi:hypothetical protein